MNAENYTSKLRKGCGCHGNITAIKDETYIFHLTVHVMS